MTQVNLTFYDVTECGYFKRDETAIQFGSLSGLLADFLAWAKDGQKKLGDTCTYHPTETSNLLRTFCYDCVADSGSGDFLLVAWNETSSFDGQVAHVKEDDEVGEVSVENTPLPPNSIPGFPTYFWFIPSRNAYATLRFESPLNGKDGMRKLLREFAAKFSEHCVHEPNTEAGHIKVLGYRENPQDETGEPLRLYARFKSQLSRKPGFVDYIKGSRANIYKIHRKNLVLQAARIESEDGSIFSKLFDRLQGGLPETGRDDVHVSYEIEVTPTETELTSIIDAWSNRVHLENRTKWEDVGFQLRGEGAKIHWLSSALIKIEPEINVNPDVNGIVDVASLLAELQRIRPTAIRSLNLRA